MSDINEYLIERGRCCACDTALKGSGHVNMVMLSKKAPWKFPRWGNLLSKGGEIGYALGVVCDDCVNEETGQINQPIKYAIEVQGGEPLKWAVSEGFENIEENHDSGVRTTRFILYHDVDDLKDGQPEFDNDPEEVALQLHKEFNKEHDLTSLIAMQGLDAEKINAIGLRQSAYYLMLISHTYVKGIQDPNDPQHYDLINQIEIAAEGKKPTIIIYTETVTPEDKEIVELFTKNLDVRATITHTFTEGAIDEELTKKIGDLLKSLKEEKND